MAGLIRRAARWLIPYAIYVRMGQGLQQTRAAQAKGLERDLLPRIRNNASLQGIHAGRRGFIVCNGPSINKQDLLPLRGEVVLTVSNGYHHRYYREIAPKYHCVPQISAPKLTRVDKIAWLKEMHEQTGRAELFLAESEAALVAEAGLFPGRTVRYLSLTESFDAFSRKDVIDISRLTPGVQSVSVMCLMIAMYMRLSPIYLLGTEHDHFRTGKYEYFYQPTLLRGTDPDVTEQGIVTTSLHDEFAALHRLWSQYRQLREIGEANDISIFNATTGGALDEYPRVRFESLFQSAHPTV